MNINDLEDQVADLVADYIESCVLVSSDELGLDPRAGSRLFVHESDGVIVCPQLLIGVLENYGGFEYIDSDYTSEMGGYKFYNKHNRVFDCLDYYKENNE